MRILAKHFPIWVPILINAVDGNNKVVASFEGRVLVTARKFKELGAASDKEIETLQVEDRTTRSVQLSELPILPGLADEPSVPIRNESK